MTSKYEDLFHRDLLAALKAYAAGAVLSPEQVASLAKDFARVYFDVTSNRQLADYRFVGEPLSEYRKSITGKQFRKSFIQEIRTFLHHPEPRVRERAVGELETMRAVDEVTVQQLIDLLQHEPDASVRDAPVIFLSKLAPRYPQLLEVLQARLKQGEPGWVREWIEGALNKANPSNSSITSTDVISVEGRRDDAAVIGELLEDVRRDKDRGMTLRWLGEMPQANKPKVIGVLLDVLQHDSYEPNRWNAAEALATFAKTNEVVIPFVLDLLRQNNDEDTLDALIEGKLIYLLVGNDQAIAILLERVKHERSNEDDQPRAAMVKLLIYISADRPDVIDALLDVLQHDSGWMARLEAIHGLGELGAGDDRVVAALLSELANQQSKDSVLEDTLYALAKVGQGVSAVVDAALNVLMQALATLPKLAEGQTEAWEIKRLHDRNKQLRRASVHALGKVGIASPPVITALEQRLMQDPDAWIQVGAAEALTKLGIRDEHIIAALKGIISDEKSEFDRKEALSLLGQIASDREDVQQILYELAKSVKTGPIHNTAFLRLYKAVVEDIEIGWPN